MALSRTAIAGRIGYALLFCGLVPAVLVIWARGTREMVQLPVFGNPALGCALLVCGAAMMLLGMGALWFQGGGLPMNLSPPPRLVSTGIFRLVPHPIYAGFGLAAVGIAMAVGSASGLWLISPAVFLGCAGLVWGYELPDLERRFGAASQNLRWLAEESGEKPSVLDRVRCYLFTILPWLALYEITLSVGMPEHGWNTVFGFEWRLPVWTWMEAIYASTYVVAALAPAFALTKRDLRAFTLRAVLAMVLIFPLYIAIPAFSAWRPFVPTDSWGRLLAWEQSLETPAAAFPSFHVVWALLAAEALGSGRRRRWMWRVWAGLVAASCVMTGMHSLADVLAGAVAAAVVIRAGAVWEFLRNASERIANSWREWRIGPVRVISHGFYAGAATLVAVLVAGALAGPAHQRMVAIATAGGLVGAGLWAQWIEGSPRLLRPFGFYGGLLGVTVAACLSRPAGSDPWLILAAYSVAAPWLQSIGRLRCLVQGCCHGKPARCAIGIRYLHPRSRVTRIAGLERVPLHPTPLYSILGNMFAAIVVTRLWVIGAPLHLIGGVYLMLNGIARFIEEAYRGEPQTPVAAGLRLYQWIALATILLGAVVTALGRSGGAPAPQFEWSIAGWAFAFGVASTIALGVDFPNSNRRFSRLA